MAESSDVIVTATRYNVARIQVVRILVPLMMVLTVVARRTTAPALVFAAFALILLTLGVALSSRRALGRRFLQVRRGVIHLGIEPGGETKEDHPIGDIVVRLVRQWTWNGSIARLYGGEHSWKLRSCNEKDETLGDILRHALGPARILRRRGSPRARAIALSVSVLGFAGAGVGIGYESIALLAVGLPCAIFGLAAFGALSQSVAR